MYRPGCGSMVHAAGLSGHSFISGINHCIRQPASYTQGYFIHVFQHKPTPGLQTLAGSQTTAQNQSEELNHRHRFPSTVTCLEGAEVTPSLLTPDSTRHRLQPDCFQLPRNKQRMEAIAANAAKWLLCLINRSDESC